MSDLQSVICNLQSAISVPPVLALILALTAACQPDPRQTLLPVPLPSLEGLPDAAQEQLRRQHAKTEAAADSVSSTLLGSEYGKLGQLLFTYDFLEAAEPAFHNAQSLRPEDERWPYYQGMLYRQQGNFEASAAQFERVLEHAPDDVLARLRLAEAQFELGSPELARQALASVIAAEPQNAFAHFLLGQIAFDAEGYDSAVVHYATVLDLQPNANQVHATLAMAYRNLGDEEQSRFHSARRGQALVQLSDPRVSELEAFKRTSGATALTDGQRLIDAGRYAEAIAALEQFVAQDSTNASAFLSLGVARSYAGDQAAAVEALRQSLRVDSTQSKPHYNLGVIFSANGQPERAEVEFHAAITIDPQHKNARLELAELLRRTKRCREAVQHFRVTLEITPGDIAARQHLVLCHLRLKQDAAARDLLEDGLTGNPDHVGFLDALARVLAASSEARVRDGTRALQLAEQALGRQRRTETLETIAMAYAEVGRFDDAITSQGEAISAAERRGQRVYVAHLRENLRRYQQGTPCRTPWPDFVYGL